METIPDFHEDNCYDCYPPDGMDSQTFFNQTETCLRIDKGEITEAQVISRNLTGEWGYKSFVYLDFDAKRLNIL